MPIGKPRPATNKNNRHLPLQGRHMAGVPAISITFKAAYTFLPSPIFPPQLLSCRRIGFLYALPLSPPTPPPRWLWFWSGSFLSRLCAHSRLALSSSFGQATKNSCAPKSPPRTIVSPSPHLRSEIPDGTGDPGRSPVAVRGFVCGARKLGSHPSGISDSSALDTSCLNPPLPTSFPHIICVGSRPSGCLAKLRTAVSVPRRWFPCCDIKRLHIGALPIFAAIAAVPDSSYKEPGGYRPQTLVVVTARGLRHVSVK